MTPTPDPLGTCGSHNYPHPEHFTCTLWRLPDAQTEHYCGEPTGRCTYDGCAFPDNPRYNHEHATPTPPVPGEPKKILRGPRAHSVSWMLSGEWLEGTMTCHCVEGADCRMICSEGCDSFNLVDHEHPLEDYGKCGFVEWMENDGALEAHTGTHAPVDGFIQIEFDDDHYTWRYSDDG